MQGTQPRAHQHPRLSSRPAPDTPVGAASRHPSSKIARRVPWPRVWPRPSSVAALRRVLSFRVRLAREDLRNSVGGWRRLNVGVRRVWVEGSCGGAAVQRCHKRDNNNAVMAVTMRVTPFVTAARTRSHWRVPVFRTLSSFLTRLHSLPCCLVTPQHYHRIQRRH